MNYTLFRKTVRKPKENRRDPFWSLFKPEKQGEEWKDGGAEEEKPVEILEYVGTVESPKQIAELVRKAPLEKYVLFRGEMVEVQVAVPVFVEGKSLDSMEDEWS